MMQTTPESNPFKMLTARIAALELRVAALEHPTQAVPQTIVQSTEVAKPAATAVSVAGTGTAFTGVLSLFGAALLGIAGAYVLRAISGASLLPRGVVAGLAALYATIWLLAAARPTARKLAATLLAAASILILAPMLWEMSIRFQAMSATSAAVYLAAYAAIATVLGLRSGSRSAQLTVFTVAISGSALTAVALSIATHSMALFTAILVAMYGVSELSSLRDRARGVRVLLALCADASAWALLYVYSLPPGEQVGYKPLSSAVILCAVVLLFAIQVVSVMTQTVWRAQPVGAFTVLQVILSFALLAFGMTWFVPDRGRQAFGLLCLLLAAGGYAAGFGPIRRTANRRSLGIFLVWSCALLFAATVLLASPPVASAILAVLAVASVPLAARMQAQSIEVQGTIFLCAAAITSGLLSYAARALVGKLPGVPAWSVVLVAIAALLTYAVGREVPGEPVLSQVLHVFQSLLAAYGAVALLVRGLAALAALAPTPGVLHIAVLRTLALCLMAAVLAWLGARLGRVQMVRVAYAALVLATVKLLFEDLRIGRMEFIAVSISLVALTLIGIPRLARTPVPDKSDR